MILPTDSLDEDAKGEMRNDVNRLWDDDEDEYDYPIECAECGDVGLGDPYKAIREEDGDECDFCQTCFYSGLHRGEFTDVFDYKSKTWVNLIHLKDDTIYKRILRGESK